MLEYYKKEKNRVSNFEMIIKISVSLADNFRIGIIYLHRYYYNSCMTRNQHSRDVRRVLRFQLV